MALTDNLDEYFKCDDNAASNVVINDGLSGVNAVMINDDTDNISVAGVVDEAFSLGTTRHLLRSGAPTAMNAGLTNDFSFNFWLEAVEPQNADVLAQIALDVDNGVKISYQNVNEISCNVEAAGVGKGATFITPDWSLGTFNMYTLVWDGTTQTPILYYNGVPDTGAALTGGAGNAIAGLSMTATTGNASRNQAIIDEIHFFSRKLSAADVNVIHINNLAGVAIDAASQPPQLDLTSVKQRIEV